LCGIVRVDDARVRLLVRRELAPLKANDALTRTRKLRARRRVPIGRGQSFNRKDGGDN